MACLDTTLLLDLAGRGGAELQLRAEQKVRQLLAEGRTLSTTRFCVAELYVGVWKARDPGSEERRTRTLLTAYVILGFDDGAAWLYGELVAHLHRLGRPIGTMDALIAATAMAAREALVTRNASHFADIPGLEVEEY